MAPSRPQQRLGRHLGVASLANQLAWAALAGHISLAFGIQARSAALQKALAALEADEDW